MLNSVTIMGRLTSDPELRTTSNGAKLVRVRVAVERDRGSKDGKKETDFIPIVAWRGTAEFLAKNFKKGQLVIVCGRLESRSWTDKEGNKHSDLELSTNSEGGIYFAESKRPASTSAPAAPKAPEYSGYARPASAPASDFAMLGDEDAQLPF